MSESSIIDASLTLPLLDRIELADRLYASIPKDWKAEADSAWLREAERRSDEMDSSDCELTEEEFVSGIRSQMIQS